VRFVSRMISCPHQHIMNFVILTRISELATFSHCAHTWITLRFPRFSYCITSSALSPTSTALSPTSTALSPTSTLSSVLTISTTLAHAFETHNERTQIEETIHYLFSEHPRYRQAHQHCFVETNSKTKQKRNCDEN
jgi:hypothetical protein